MDRALMRPKAVALMCYLGAQRNSVASRDAVMDALWPDFDPDQALNSLHQTVYFLRRYLEDEYDQDTSPGYLISEGELLRLDPELVDTRSRRFVAAVDGVDGDPSPDVLDEVLSEYPGTFAEDFLYEEWAIRARDEIHARFVEITEKVVNWDTAVSHYGRALRVARRALSIDPSLDVVERQVIRLCRLQGAHASAAEHYAHYAAGLAELGVEAPPIENI